MGIERLMATLVPAGPESQARIFGALREARRAMLHGVVLLGLLISGSCGKPETAKAPEPRTGSPPPVEADTGRTIALAVPSAEEARGWFSRVSRTAPARVTPRAALEAPLPEAPAEAPPSDSAPREALPVDEGLQPPIPRTAAAQGGKGVRGVQVELDLRIDENGEVSDALWAGGSADSSVVRLATEAALALQFHPALQRGVPVAVWCRQRFVVERGIARSVAAGD